MKLHLRANTEENPLSSPRHLRAMIFVSLSRLPSLLSPFFFAPRAFLHADFFGFVSTGDCSIETFPSREKPYRYAFNVLPSWGPRYTSRKLDVKEKHSNSGSNDVASLPVYFYRCNKPVPGGRIYGEYFLRMAIRVKRVSFVSSIQLLLYEPSSISIGIEHVIFIFFYHLSKRSIMDQ